MKERQLNNETYNEVDFLFSKRGLAVFMVVIVLYVGGLDYYSEQITRLRNKCIAEQVIDEKGNPALNFRLEVKDPCDEFITSGDIKKAKGYRDSVPGQFGGPW